MFEEHFCVNLHASKNLYKNKWAPKTHWLDNFKHQFHFKFHSLSLSLTRNKNSVFSYDQLTTGVLRGKNFKNVKYFR